ncbi:MAG: VOC family protein [Pseudomonadota bacterium]
MPEHIRDALAKPALDVGLYTNQLDNMLAFWQEQAQLPFSEMLPVGGGVRQHRHAVGDSVLKINHTREPLPVAPSGLASLTIYSDHVSEPLELLDPDGNELILSPPDSNPGVNLSLQLHSPNATAQQQFYGDTLGLSSLAPDTFAVGASRLQILPNSGPGATGDHDSAAKVRAARGYRYMTVQVYDVVSTHAAILNRGGREGMAPVRLGDVAYISFVLDADGNWIEISQRKSITGSLD